MFDKNACSLEGRKSLDVWSWSEYKTKKQELGEKVVLVDMIGHPLNGSIEISDEIFSGAYPDGTIFALYCHSGGSSGFLQMQLSKMMINYTFINIKGGIMSLNIEL